MDGSHHSVLCGEDRSQEIEEDSSSPEEKEPVKQYENKEDEDISKHLSEESTPEEDDILAQSSKILFRFTFNR